jgi:hypothetical protein
MNVIDKLAPKNNYDHRLMGYNNNPTATTVWLGCAKRGTI